MTTVDGQHGAGQRGRKERGWVLGARCTAVFRVMARHQVWLRPAQPREDHAPQSWRG